MSRTPANTGMTVVRGATWEDELVYRDSEDRAIDLTGYEARMQVREMSGRYGLDSESLLLELSTANGLLSIDAPPGETVPCRVLIRVEPEGHAVLNPGNAKKAKYAWALELFQPAVAGAEYVVPMIAGKLTVMGNTYR